MTDSAASFLAVILGVGVFLVIVAVGWRSVQNRRILRVQGADGQQTIIVAGEDDDISSVVTTTTSEASQPAPAGANASVADPVPAPEFGRIAIKNEATGDV